KKKKKKILYNQLSEYVTTQYNKALTKDKKRNVAFALVILQRRFASSTYALLCSLDRRRNKLMELLKKVDSANVPVTNKIFDFDEIEDLSEDQRWEEEDEILSLSASENRAELEKEIATLNELYDAAKKIIDNLEEIKLRELKNTLDLLDEKFPEQKIIIFTESRDTLEYLYKRITNTWKYTAVTIHGGMKLEARIDAEKSFKNDSIRVLIATEAAGEGINLQFCHLMINYDIPWNPNRLEQRMGRIHRYGQTKEVFIYNLVAKDTREGEVMYRIFEKLNEIKQAMGSDKVFDVISDVFIGKSLAQLLLDASMNARNKEDILKEIDIKIDKEYIQKVKENLGDTLATRFIDYTQIKELNDKAREYRLIPEYTEAFFKKAYEKAGGQITFRDDGFVSVDSVPFAIRTIANDINFKKKFGTIQVKYKKTSFDKQKAQSESDSEFLSFGHPLFEAVMQWIEKELYNTIKQGAVFTDPSNKYNGIIVYYEARINDGKNEVAGKRLFAIYHDRNNSTILPFSASLIWELCATGIISEPPVDVEDIKNKALPGIFKSLMEYKSELQVERDRQAGIKEKYGLRSLDELILRLDHDLVLLYDRKDKGESVELPIRNKEEQKRIYEQSKEKLKKEIRLEKTLAISNPVFIGAIRVIPSEVVSDEMVSDADIEKIGMDKAMVYERSQGRIPEDVSDRDLGYDILSKDLQGNVRRIEVKTRAKTGAIALTVNEMFKARRFTIEYYLYVVFNAATNPELIIINDPADNLLAIEREEVVRFIIDSEEILKKGQKQI
ncbi:MAG: DUF3883 domain-containing protein, partial [Bacteroidia bacterium]|nr:DUF3883 domain-containing protein [Bacteroidia bacterium]